MQNKVEKTTNNPYQHAGIDYLSLLSLMHKHLSPQTYLEIGACTGSSLRLSKCASIAIDPKFQITADIITDKPSLFCFQDTSDRFFDKHDPIDFFKKKIDFAFLDGMHLFEFLLRDFIKTERSCNKNSVVAIHDCLPIDHYMAGRLQLPSKQSRSHNPNWWTGDVWKIVPILKRYRPEIQIMCLNAAPTGLVVCTNLDPSSRILENSYASILSEWRNLELKESDVKIYLNSCPIISTDTIDTFEKMSRYFWL